MPIPPITTPDGRRAWAFVVIWIGCVVFTLFAAVGVWLVSSNAFYSLILALAAHVQLLVGMGAFSFVLGRRMMIRVSREGAEFDDREAPATPAQGAQAAAGAAQVVADELGATERDREPAITPEGDR